MIDPDDPRLAEFLAERHLATLTLRRPDGRPHVTPVGFSWDAERRLARVITWGGAWKARHAGAMAGERAGARAEAALCQVDGRRWVTLYGRPQVSDDPQRTAEAERRYGERYRPARERDDRVVIEIEVTEIIGTL